LWSYPDTASEDADVVFKKMLRAFGVGGPSVDTVLSDPNTVPGGTLTGQIHLLGGDHAVDIEHVALGLITRVEVEGADSEYDTNIEFHRVPVTGAFQLPQGARHAIPFEFPVPWETPITTVFGQHLHGMTMGLRTELSVARAVDKGDLDPVSVNPLPSQAAILGAFSQLGFVFKGADLERGHIRGVRQTLPFYQEIEFYSARQYSHALAEVEVTMVTSSAGIDVILELDKRGGLFTAGHDVFHHFHVEHAAANSTHWTTEIDAFLRRVTGH
jgi:sporulation-control protein